MFSRISYYYSSDIRHLQNSYLRLYFSSLASQSSSDSTNTNLASSPISHDDFLPSLADDLHEFRFSVAPMMGVTNRHQRQFMRYITKSALLYTEMVVAGTIIYSKKLETHLGANFEEENPVVLQLGGADPHQLATAASIAMQYGYERFNLNVGCPSDRVSGSGCFGASLMMRPELVADISRAIADKTTIVPSIKCRIGVNDDDHYGYLANFVDVVSRKGGVSQFIIHARKAVLDPAWSPQKNRTIPPLKYEYVYQLLREFPHLDIGINGGIKSYEEIVSHVQHGADEVMIGRGVMENPFYYRHIDQLIKSSSTSAALTPSLVTRGEVLRKYVSYIQQQEEAVQDGTVSCSYLLSPVLNLFTGCRNGRLFRRILSELEKDSLSAKKIGDEVLRASEVISIDVMDS